MVKTVEEVRKHYSINRNIEYRIKLATEGFTGKLITHNFKRLVGLLSPYRRGEKVVDVGCGWGYLMSFFPSCVDAYAFDISRRMLSVSNVFNGDAKRIICNAQKTGLRDDSFDKLFCVGLTGHVPKLKEALGDMYRILKPDGSGIINFTNKFGAVNFPVTLFGLKVGYYFNYNTCAPLDKSLSYLEAKALLESVGFKSLQTYGWGISVPYSLGQKVPSIANKITDYVIRFQDSFLVKQLSNALVFKVRKSKDGTD